MSWLVGAVLILLAAFALQMGLLAFAMYVLIMVILFSRILARTWIESVEVTREVNREEAAVGDTIVVNVAITNTGRWPIGWLLIEDLLPRRAIIFNPPSLKVIGRRMMLTMLRPGETRHLNFQLQCNRRGYYQIGPTVVESGDLFGLHRRFRIEGEPKFVTVFPEVHPIQGYDIASRRPIGEVRMTYQLFEDPTRIAGVRRYQAGDPLNRDHWHATARPGTLHSKIYEPSSVAGATLLLDFHKGSYATRHEPLRSELAITAAASLANALYELSQQVGLISNGRDAVDRINTEGWTTPPRTRQAMRNVASMRDRSERLRPVIVPTARGAATRMQIVEALARLELTDGMSVPDLIMETASRIPRDASVIAILPTVTEQTAIALGSLVTRGLAVTAIINTYEATDFADLSGPLLAQGISIRHLRDESAIMTICRKFATSGIG
jgi:uncharacterized repeat protein (TIGR01451 family)